MSRAMKDSGIPWIGEIPKEWGIYRIKYNTFLKGRIGWQGLNSNDFLDEGYCLITGTDFDNKGGINWNTCYRISKERFDEDELLHIKCGDLLMTKDGTVGKMAYIKQLPEEASLNSHLLIIRQLSKLMDNSYLYWVMLSPVFNEFCAIYQAGTIMSSISQSTLGLFSCQLPSKKEQKRIAEFLDRKCGEIDETIALQEEFIEELKAYKQSVITEAVTRGLNSNVEFKDSCIDWIGKIPQGWEIRRIKTIGSAKNGLTYSPSDMTSEEDGILVLRSSNIQNGKLCFEDNVFVSTKIPTDLMVHKGDLIICSRNGSAALVGKCAMVEDDNLIATYGAFMMRFQSQYTKRYIYYLLTSAITQYKPLFTTTTINQLTAGIFGGLAVPFSPNLTEQQKIADYLDTKCAEIDSLIAVKQQKIDELKDYKKSIIYEYVTGKKEI